MKTMMLLLSSTLLMLGCSARKTVTDNRERQVIIPNIDPADEGWFRERAQRIASKLDSNLNLTNIEEGEDHGYWGAGHVVAQISRLARKGTFFKSNEVDLFVSPPLADSGDFPGQIFRMSVLDDELFTSFKTLNARTYYIVKYVRVYKYRPVFTTETPYYIWAIEPVTPSFDKTRSFSEHGESYTEPVRTTKQRKGIFSESTRRGYVLNVMRWGFDTFGKTCTIFFHEGGRRSIGATADSSGSQFNAVNAGPMNTYEEEGCRFAEDVLRTGTYSEIETSRQYVEWWNSHATTIHAMKRVKRTAQNGDSQAPQH